MVKRSRDEKIALRPHCVLATSVEFFLRPYTACAASMVRPCYVGEDRTTLLACSIGAHHVHARSRFSQRLCYVERI